MGSRGAGGRRRSLRLRLASCGGNVGPAPDERSRQGIGPLYTLEEFKRFLLNDLRPSNIRSQDVFREYRGIRQRSSRLGTSFKANFQGKRNKCPFVLTTNLAYTAPGNSTSNPGVTAAFTKMTCISGNGCLRVGRDGGAAAADLRLSELSGEYPDRGLIGILLNVQIFWSCWTRIAVKC